MKRFYGLLVAVAVVAGVLIWKGTRPGPGEASTAGAPPVAFTAADSAFRGYAQGSDSAPVEIVEYADLQCPHCGEFAVVQFPTIREQLISTGRVRWRMRDFPLNFSWSRVSALAAQCAGEQGRYWEMVDAMYQAQSDWGRSTKNPSGQFRDMARRVGVDGNRFDACVDSHRYDGRIEASRAQGQALGVSGTPTFFVNGRMKTDNNLSSDRFQQIVDSAIAATQQH
jgi:protein-disulfide isomerase